MIEDIHEAGVRLLVLRQRLRAREGKPGFAANVAAIKEEIARLEAITAGGPVASSGEPSN